MGKYIYLTCNPEALVASMLPPEGFGLYLSTGTKKRNKGQSIFFEVDLGKIEKLIDTYSDYKFAEKAIPRLEDMIVDRIKKSGPGRDRFVAKVVIGTQGKIRNTVRAIAGSSKDKGMLEYSQELPGDYDGLAAMTQAPNWGENSILRFGFHESGVAIDIKGYKYLGRGDKLHQLTFVLIKNVGFVYVRGKGQVASPKGEVFEF